MYNAVYSTLYCYLCNVDNVLLCVIYQLNFILFMYVTCTRISRYMMLYIVFGIIRGLT